MWRACLIAALAAAALLFLPAAEAALRYAAGAGVGTGNWNATATWNSTGCGNATNNPTVPAAADDVIICPNRTVITTANQSALTITINNAGILRMGNNTTARTLTVSGDITIDAGGIFEANPAFAAQHLLSHTGIAGVGGNIINDGTINFSNTSGGNNAVCNVTFSGWTGTRTVSGTGTSGFNRITINGNSNTINDIVDITAANFSMAAVGIAAPSAPLVLTDGTFRLSTPATIAPFGTAAFTLATNDRFWLNHPGATVDYPVAATFTVNAGQLRIDDGTFNATANVATAMNVTSGRLEINGGTLNIGSAVNNTLLLTSNAASTIQMSGGAINVAGRLASSATGGAGVFNLSGGTITTGIVGNNTNNALNAPFFIGSAVSYTQSGGAIVIENANAANNAREYDVRATLANSSITGGTLQIGNATSAAGQTFQINSVPPVWNLDIVNNGIPSDPVALLIASLTINNNLTIGNGTTISAGNNNITILGNWINNSVTNSYIVNNGTVTFAGTAAQSLLGTSTETTINRLIMNNTAAADTDRKLTLNHDLRATNYLTLTSGRIASSGLNTNPATPKVIIPSGASLNGGSSSSYVSGRLQLNIPSGNNKTVAYPIGTEGASAPALAYSPASFTFLNSGGVTGELIAYAVQGDHPQIATSTLDATKSVNRYWVLTDAGVSGTAADLTTSTMETTFTFLNPEDLDAGADTAVFQTERYSGGAWFTPPAGTRTATTTSATTVNNLGEFAVGERGTGGAPGGGFNIFDTDTMPLTATAGVIKTKVAGANFNLAVVSLNPGGPPRTIDTSYNRTVRVELLDASNNSGVLDADGCNPNWTTVIATLTPDPSFSPSDNGRITVGPFNVANAYRDVRARVTNVTGVARRGCSSDNFAIRPNAFTAFSVSDDGTPNNFGTARALDNVTFGAVIHKAGRPVSVRANAVNAAGTPAITTNYTGSPTATLSACAGAACTATFGTFTVGAAFVAGQLGSNVASYSEVGAFSLKLIDDTFAAVDSADGSSVAEMRIESAAINVGRFVPNHFAVTPTAPTLGTACGSGSFTYVGQAFNYTVQPVLTVQAQNAAGNPTALYTDNTKWWRITNVSLTGKAYTWAAPLGITLDTSGITGADPVINVAGGGSGSLTFSSGTGLFFTRTTPVAPFNAEIALAINVIDADGVVYESPIGTAANPVSFGAASAGNGIAFSSGKEMRFGRLRIGNASGSQLLPLSVQMQAQYWGSTNPPTNTQYAFITNDVDSCTSITAVNIAMGPYSNNLNACESSLSVGGTPAGRFSAGRNTVQLSAPGSGNNGSVDLTVNLGAGSGTTCIAGAPTPVTGANGVYLQGNWTGASYDQNPAARAAFGLYRGSEEVTYIRENY